MVDVAAVAKQNISAGTPLHGIGTELFYGHAVVDEEMREGNYFISVRGDSERLDPDDAYFMRYHTSEIGKNNWSRYSNKEVDALLEKGRTTWKWEERVPFYKKVVEIAREELPLHYLAKSNIPLVFRDYVKGLKGESSTWFGYYREGLKKVWLDK